VEFGYTGNTPVFGDKEKVVLQGAVHDAIAFFQLTCLPSVSSS
jgi:hypothetical protein